MSIPTTLRRLIAAALFALPVAASVPMLLPGLSLAAQDRGPVNRVLTGKVQDASGAGVKGAVVYLKDSHTSSIKSAVVDDDGSYRFVQLAQNTDYELWAKLGEKRGPSKNISSYDSKPQLVINLRVD